MSRLEQMIAHFTATTVDSQIALCDMAKRYAENRPARLTPALRLMPSVPRTKAEFDVTRGENHDHAR
jgi:hypothetical protein